MYNNNSVGNISSSCNAASPYQQTTTYLPCPNTTTTSSCSIEYTQTPCNQNQFSCNQRYVDQTNTMQNYDCASSFRSPQYWNDNLRNMDVWSRADQPELSSIYWHWENLNNPQPAY